MTEEELKEKGARLLKSIQDIRELQRRENELYDELEEVALILAHGVDPREVKTARLWWDAGKPMPRGTIYTMKDGSEKTLQGFLDSRFKGPEVDKGRAFLAKQKRVS